MNMYIIPVDHIDSDYLFEWGVLNYRSFAAKIKFIEGDRFFISDSSESIICGPFLVVDPRPLKYVNKACRSSSATPQIICSILHKIGRMQYSFLSEIEILDEVKYNSIIDQMGINLAMDQNNSVTGDYEVDGLLNFAYKDIILGKYCIKFVIYDKDLQLYYVNKLRACGISSRLSSYGRIIIDDDSVCEKCMLLNYTEMIGNDEFIIGFLAPQMFVLRGYPGLDAPLELFRSIVISDSLDNSLVSKKDDTGIIIVKDRYSRNRISPLSIRRDPLNIIVKNCFPFEEENKAERSVIDPELDPYRYKAASDVLMNIFRLSNYTISNIKNVNEIVFFNVNLLDSVFTIVCVSDFDSLLINELYDLSDPENSYAIVIKNSKSPNLKMIKVSRLLKWLLSHSKNDINYDDVEYLFYNLENNPEITMCDPVVAEFEYKISLIWSV